MKWIIYIAFMIPFLGYTQGRVGVILEDLPSDTITHTLKEHSGMKPRIRLARGNERERYIRLNALGDVNYIQANRSQYKLGVGLEVESSINDKWYIRAAGVQGVYDTDTLFTPKSYVRVPVGSTNLYTDMRGRVSYTPNHIFNFQAGLDHNFIGEGSRSLFLSDYGNPYPFGLIRANFWRFEYSILYQFMKERDQNRWEGKFASSHHISFNAAKWLNIGVFETVIFQPKDTNLRRGFDIEYLNPLVFYRPQEYSLGSSDNVLLGVSLTANWKGHYFYSQFILDEFYLAELRAKTGWWANKFGGQFGFKGRFGNGNHRFFYRAEYNFVRPYTYAHISEELNYGNQGLSLAHPYGSNFKELLAEFKWSHKKWNAKFFGSYFLKGLDQDGFSYGGDIYQSYTARPYEYDHWTGQGLRENGLRFMISGSYQVSKMGNLNAFVENHLHHSMLNDRWNYTLVVGVRSMLWNDYRNY